MNVSRRTLVTLGACAVAVTGALGWATSHALRLERRELEAQAHADFQGRIRLALWRMDSALTPIVARETGRPYFHYSAFYPAARAYTSMLQDVAPGEALLPSPLLTLDQQFVRLYFQRSATGELTSPQVPSGNFRDLAESRPFIGTDRVLAAESRLAELSLVLASAGRARLLVGTELDKLPTDPGVVPPPPAEAPSPRYRSEEIPEQDKRAAPTSQLAQSIEQSAREYGERQQAVGRAKELEKTANAVQSLSTTPAPAPAAPAAPDADHKVTASLSKQIEDQVHLKAGSGGSESRAAKPADEVAHSLAVAPAKSSDVARRKRDDSKDADTGAAPAPAGGEAGRVLVFKNPAEFDESRAEKKESRDGAQAMDTDRLLSPQPDVEQDDMTPVWREAPTGQPQLLLLRSVRVRDTRLEQGCWLDWPALRVWLLASVQDLLPGAALQPVTDPYGQAEPEALGRRLAGVSAELEPGAEPALALPRWTPMRSTLALTWGAVLLSLGAIGAALLAARDLAERRGQFVSAVTHELRTPLTTFNLYSQMLADGMVTDEPARRDYLFTLRRESERLTRIVENVLEYARVGRAAHAARREPMEVGALLDRVLPALRARTGQCAVPLDVPDLDASLAATVVEIDPVSVERILLNLVDNACKYAGAAAHPAGAPAPPVTITPRAAPRFIDIDITDRGPGIPRDHQHRLFQPFERGRSLEHATTPGLGLGLALSRALARRMGGDLLLADTSDRGTTFTLRLPLATPRS